ncbi:MAG: tRNA (N(6)-L-threonylcarbamoyladenosine(37)-C(2))-methylthiotransferase MtaB [Thermoanaerobaculia bacterium]
MRYAPAGIMKVYFTNLGCKLNQAELERLAREFHFAGHRVVPRLEEADLHVVNSCTVTHRAARDSRKVARRGARRRPGVRTVLTGCYATGSPEEAAALAGVDLVVPNAEKDRLLDRVHEAFPDARPETSRPRAEGRPDGAGALDVPFVSLAFGNTRTLVKVEDGCNVGCAFCIIPHTRGRQRSRPVPEIVAEVRSMAAAGFREVVVTGVQISHYRWQGRGLCDLVETLLAETGIPRIRLTSIAPWAFDRRLLDLLREERICRHVHMSLQSGCDATLERMRRPYRAAAYRALVDQIRGAVPGVAVTTDVIVGFPGETAAELAESLRFVESVGFARTHVFSYSPREGTPAASMPDPVPPELVKARTAAMIEAAAPGERSFREAHLGRTVQVLWEARKGSAWHGLTDNYLRVETEAAASAELENAVTGARIQALTGDGVRGELAGRSGDVRQGAPVPSTVDHGVPHRPAESGSPADRRSGLLPVIAADRSARA